MDRLLIIGAGGFGREMFAAARESVGFGESFAIGGFLDDRPGALDAFSGYPPVLADIEHYEPQSGDVFITALGDVSLRKRCALSFEARGARFITIVHRSAMLGPNVAVGPGSFIAPGVSLTADITVGRHVCIFHNSSVGHDSSLGDFSHVYAQCSIGGGVKIGETARVFPGSVVTPRRTVGDGATVGALSAVFTDVPPHSRVIGNPAAPLE